MRGDGGLEKRSTSWVIWKDMVFYFQTGNCFGKKNKSYCFGNILLWKKKSISFLGIAQGIRLFSTFLYQGMLFFFELSRVFEVFVGNFLVLFCPLLFGCSLGFAATTCLEQIKLL